MRLARKHHAPAGHAHARRLPARQMSARVAEAANARLDDQDAQSATGFFYMAKPVPYFLEASLGEGPGIGPAAKAHP